jgi:hypothetical protein
MSATCPTTSIEKDESTIVIFTLVEAFIAIVM